MTIYALHHNRGKVQVLATYQGSTGTTSSTVTSVADISLAEPIVDALNRISCLATMPVSIYDSRGGSFNHYPQTHLAALTDRGARANLLTGAHSLWYEHAKLLLHQALSDLDDAMAAVPAPVQKAIAAELETEVRELRYALAEFSEGVSPPETENPRYWEFEFPFVAFDGGMGELSRDSRELLDRQEKGITLEQREKAVADLRLLVTAYAQYRGDQAVLETGNFAIFEEPDGSDGYYVTVDAPSPGDDSNGLWRIAVGRWEPDDPEDENCSSATGSSVLTCVCSAPPTAFEIAALLHRSEEHPEQLRAWADTEVGETLAETTFVVTQRHDA